MLKEKKEKNLIAAIIKFLYDKLKELIRKIFARDLSFDQRLDKEIKELQEKLNSGELSEEEFARALERLTALQDLKLRLQMAVVGWIVTMFAEMFGVELAAIVEASTEETNKAEDKKAEKTSLEATKEVHKDVEIKVDEREKPAVPVSLFEVSPGFVRPVVLSKPELDLLPKPMKELMPKEVIKEEIRKVKPKVEEEKKAKPEEPKKEVCPPKVPEQPVKKEVKLQADGEFKTDKDKLRRKNLSSNNPLRRKSSSNPKPHNYSVGTWNGTEHETQHSSASSAQAKVSSEFTGAKVNNLVESQPIGKTPS